MKKSLFIVFMFLVFTGSAAHATIIIVDNKVPSAGQYSTLQAAHDAASNGDTIYVYPSGVAYNAITVTKQLHLVGTGFDYPGEDLNTTLIYGLFTFDPGSDNSTLEGFRNGGNFSIMINSNNIIIKRNRLLTINVASYHVGNVIIGNFIYSNGIAAVIEVSDYNEILIANNFISNTYSNSNQRTVMASGANITINLIHNVIKGYNHSISVDNSNKFIANNIIVFGRATGCSTGTYYNMDDQHWLPNSNGNILDADMNSVFVDKDNYNFHLLPNSPARGAGQNDVDMGIYGGSTPFVDGGAPGIPSIIQIQSDHAGSQEGGLDVIIKAKSNKE